jgi:transposase
MNKFITKVKDYLINTDKRFANMQRKLQKQREELTRLQQVSTQRKKTIAKLVVELEETNQELLKFHTVYEAMRQGFLIKINVNKSSGKSRS